MQPGVVQSAGAARDRDLQVNGSPRQFGGKILGISEFELHALLAQQDETVNYSTDDLAVDIENNDL